MNIPSPWGYISISFIYIAPYHLNVMIESAIETFHTQIYKYIFLTSLKKWTAMKITEEKQHLLEELHWLRDIPKIKTIPAS